MRCLYPARCWDVQCLVLGCLCPVVGQLVLGMGAHYQDGQGPGGVPNGRMLCTRWWWGCPVAACPVLGNPCTLVGHPVLIGGAYYQDAPCPVGMPSGNAQW